MKGYEAPAFLSRVIIEARFPIQGENNLFEKGSCRINGLFIMPALVDSGVMDI